MNRVSSGHEANEEPTVSRSTKSRFSIPAWPRAIATPTPAAPAPAAAAPVAPEEAAAPTMMKKGLKK